MRDPAQCRASRQDRDVLDVLSDGEPGDRPDLQRNPHRAVRSERDAVRLRRRDRDLLYLAAALSTLAT
jgi:hypothetical protein